MEIFIACLIATLVVKNGVIDAAYAVRGKPSPRRSVAHELLKRRAAAGQHAASADRSAFRRYVAQLWEDSWDEARQKHDRRLDERRQRRIERDTAGPSTGALRRYLRAVTADTWASWDRRWDKASAKLHERRTAGQSQALAAAVIAAANATNANRASGGFEGSGTSQPISNPTIGSDAPEPRPRDGSARSPEPSGMDRPTAPPAAVTSTGAGQTDSTGTAGETANARADSAGMATVHPLSGPTGSTQEAPAVTTTSGETSTLSQTLGAIGSWEQSTQQAITSLETSIATLQGSEVGPAVTGPLGKAQEAFSQAMAAFNEARHGLEPSTQIGDMYHSNPDAGDRDFVSG